MAKRPSARQIIARQKRLERYQRATGKSNADIAKQYGLSTEQVRRFKEPASTQKRGWSKNIGSQTLFKAVGAPTGKGSTRVEGVRIVAAYTSPQRTAPYIRSLSRGERERIYRSELVVESYNTYRGPDAQELYDAKLAWAEWTEEHGLPISIKDIRDMYDNGEIDEADYDEALSHLKDFYGKH